MTGTDYAVGGSSLTLAGLDIAGQLETLPRGWLALIVLAMFIVVGIFVRRDYARFDRVAREADPTKLELLQALERQGVSHAQALQALAANQAAQLTRVQFDLSAQIGDCIHVRDFSDSIQRVYERINAVEREAREARSELSDRVLVMETTHASK